MTRFAEIQVGSKVKIIEGGLFYCNNVGKTGTVTKFGTASDIIYVQFDDDNDNDYGRTSEVELVDVEAVVGDRVRLPADTSGTAFYSYNAGKEGVVTQVTDVAVYVKFDDDSTDYGRKAVVSVIGKATELNTLDTQLAALRAQLDAIKAEKVSADQEVTHAADRLATKKAVVVEIETRQVALLSTLAKHGIQFVGETSLSAMKAHQSGLLKKSSKVVCNTSPDSYEHKVGKVYDVVQVDAHDRTCTYRFTSEAGGHWLCNSSLEGYTFIG